MAYQHVRLELSPAAVATLTIARPETLNALSAQTGVIQPGWPVPDGRLLLRDLIEFATQPEFVHRHRWRVGDLVIWDNRCTMHRGRPYEDDRHPRDLRRVTTQDVASTLDQVA